MELDYDLVIKTI